MNESEMPDGEVTYEYFEYDGHALVRVAVKPYCGADIFVNGKWESRNLARTNPSLFPMTEEEAMDIIRSGHPK